MEDLFQVVRGKLTTFKRVFKARAWRPDQNGSLGILIFEETERAVRKKRGNDLILKRL